MKKLMTLVAFTVFTAVKVHGLDHLLEKIDNQSPCTLLLLQYSHSSDVTTHDAPHTIQPYSEGFIEMGGTTSSQYVNNYAVIYDQQLVGLVEIFNSSKGYPDTVHFHQWDYYPSFLIHVHPAYVVVSNK